MNVLFINPMTFRYNRSVSTPLGLLSIASFLEVKGYNVMIFDRTVDKTNLDKVVEDFKPDICGISIISYKSIKDALFVAENLKKKNIPVIVGGPLPSVLIEGSLAHDCIDIVSIGEGEQTWLELASYYENKDTDLSTIHGIAFKNKKGNIIYTPERDFINLSKLPALNWNLINVPKYFQSSYGCKRMLYLYSAKGCPFSCTFCYNKDFHKCTYRKRPLEVLLEEITLLVENYCMDGVYFADELWCTNKDELREICLKLKNLNLNFVWGCQTRIGLFDENDFKYMYNCGCRWVFFGVESGSVRILQKINKKIVLYKVEENFKACKNAGIACIGSFITGFPDETVDDLKDTVNLIKNLDTSLINFNFLAVVPGSEIYNLLIQQGKYKPCDKLEHYDNLNPIETLEYNYSHIPDIDIKVIRAYYMWRSFTASDVPETSKFSFAKKVIADALKSVKTGNFFGFIISTLLAGLEFFKILYYAHFFPKVKKKYGLK